MRHDILGRRLSEEKRRLKHSTTKPTKLAGVQAARGVAACMVLAFHIFAIMEFEQYSSLGMIPWLRYFSNYWAGVDLFFCISGFIIFYSYSNSNFGSKNFIKGRLIRILPMYWIFTMLAVITYALQHKNEKLNVGYLLSSFLLLVDLRSNNPVLAIGWSLQYEFLFYLIFLFIYLRNRRNQFMFFAFVMILLSQFLLNGGLILEFLIGAIAYKLFNSGKWVTKKPEYFLLFFILCVGIELHYFSSEFLLDFRGLLLGIPFGCIVYFAACVKKTNEAMVTFGNYSYSLYLSHTFVLTFLTKLLLLWDIRQTPIIFLLIFLSCNLFAYLVWKYFEIKLTISIKKLFS